MKYRSKPNIQAMLSQSDLRYLVVGWVLFLVSLLDKLSKGDHGLQTDSPIQYQGGNRLIFK